LDFFNPIFKRSLFILAGFITTAPMLKVKPPFALENGAKKRRRLLHENLRRNRATKKGYHR
jgi:hypothetical protein